MKYLPEIEERIRRAIKDALAIDPLISFTQLSKVLESKGIKGVGGKGLDREYVAKLVRKVNRETLIRIERAQVTERIAEIKERHRLAVTKLLKIAFYDSGSQENAGIPSPSYKDQIAAIRELMKWDLAILSAEMDAGIFQRQLGTLEIERRNVPLRPEVKEAILIAMGNLGILKQVQEIQDQPKQHDELPAPTH